MAISDNYVPLRQIGNGVTVAFSAGWQMLAASYARVFLEDAITGVQTPVSQGPGASQYTIALTGSGFTVTFNTAPSSVFYIVIGREVALDQTDPYRTSVGFDGKVLESSLDKLTGMIQDTSELSARSLSFPLGDTTSGLLPAVNARKGLFLFFDSVTGAPVVGGVAGTTISAAMIPVVQASTLLAARTAMGIPTGLVQNNYSASTNPGVGNDNTQGYAIGSFWINTSTGRAYQAYSVSTGAAIWVEIVLTASTQTLAGKVMDFGANTFTATLAQLNTAISDADVGLILGAPNSVTGGVNRDFTGIPSGVRRVKAFFRSISTSGVNNLLVQLGTSGGIVSTGYSAGSVRLTAAPVSAASSAGAVIALASAAATLQGDFEFTLLDSATNEWSWSGNLYDSASGLLIAVSGSVALGGVLTQMRFTSVGGTDTFDAGKNNIAWSW